MLIGLWAVQDGLGIVLVRSFFRLAIRDHFVELLGCCLESFWDICGLILGHLGRVLGRRGLSWARFGALRMAFWSPRNLYSHQLIDSSTLEPMARQHFAIRAGGLREAIT